MSFYSVAGLFALGAIVLWSGAAYFAIRNLEEPSYVLIEKRNGYEIRQYDSYIIATTKVSGAYDAALNQGFRIIAGYIFGGNTQNQKIDMTIPVQETSEKIAMTVPVLEKEEFNEQWISFTMPKKYTLETLPKPLDARVELRTIPPRTVAVLPFSWWTTRNRVEAKKAELLTKLEQDNITFSGVVETAYYNPPFTPPFMLRNEVMVTIEK